MVKLSQPCCVGDAISGGLCHLHTVFPDSLTSMSAGYFCWLVGWLVSVIVDFQNFFCHLNLDRVLHIRM